MMRRSLFYLLLVLALTAAQSRAQDTPTNTPTNTPTSTPTNTVPARGAWGWNQWLAIPEDDPKWTATNVGDWEFGPGRTGAGALIVSEDGLQSTVCFDHDTAASTTEAVRLCAKITNGVTLAEGGRASWLWIDQDNEPGCFIQLVGLSATEYAWEVYYLGKETEPIFVESIPGQHTVYDCLELHQENVAGGGSPDTVFCSLRYNGRDVITNIATELVGDCSGTNCDIKGVCVGTQAGEDPLRLQVDDLAWQYNKPDWPIRDGYLFASIPDDGNLPDTDNDFDRTNGLCSTAGSGEEHNCVDDWLTGATNLDCIGAAGDSLQRNLHGPRSHTVGHQDITLATVGGDLETINTVYVTARCCNDHGTLDSDAAVRVRSSTSVSNLPSGSGATIEFGNDLFFRESFTTDPYTSAAWDESGFNAAGFGVIKDADGDPLGGRVRCTAWMAEVDVSTPDPPTNRTMCQDVDGDGECTLMYTCDSVMSGTLMGTCIGGDGGCTAACTVEADCGTGADCVDGACYMACELSSECSCASGATCSNIRQPGYQMASRMPQWDNIISCARNGMGPDWLEMIVTDVPNPSPTPDTGESVLDNPTIIGTSCNAIKGGLGVCNTDGSKCMTAAECAACGPTPGYTPIKADFLLNVCGANTLIRTQGTECEGIPTGYHMAQPNLACPEAATTPGPYQCPRVRCDNKDCDDIPCTADADCGPVGCDPGVECDCDKVTTNKCSTCAWVGNPPYQSVDHDEEDAFCSSSDGTGVTGSVCTGYCTGHQDPAWACRGDKDCGYCAEDPSIRCTPERLCTGFGFVPPPCDEDSDCTAKRAGSTCADPVAAGGATRDHPCVRCLMTTCNIEEAAEEYCTCPCGAVTCTADADCDSSGGSLIDQHGACTSAGTCSLCGPGGNPGFLVDTADEQRNYYRRQASQDDGLVAFFANKAAIDYQATDLRGRPSFWLGYMGCAIMEAMPKPAPMNMLEQHERLLRMPNTFGIQHYGGLNCSWQQDEVFAATSFYRTDCIAEDGLHLFLKGAAATAKKISLDVLALFPTCSGDQTVPCAGCEVPCDPATEQSDCDATAFGALSTPGPGACPTPTDLCVCTNDAECGDGLTCETVSTGPTVKRCVGWDADSCAPGDASTFMWFRAQDQVCTDEAAGTCSEFRGIPRCTANPDRRCTDDSDCDGEQVGDVCAGGPGTKWMPCSHDVDCPDDAGPFARPVCAHGALPGTSPTPARKLCRQPTSTPAATSTSTPTQTPTAT